MATKRKSTGSRKKATSPNIKFTDLKKFGTSDAQLKKILAKAKEAKIGFVILNAPFKVRPAEVIS